MNHLYVPNHIMAQSIADQEKKSKESFIQNNNFLLNLLKRGIYAL